MAKSQNTYNFIKFEYGTLKNFYEELTANTTVSIGYQTLGTWMRGVKPHESNMSDYTAIMDYLTETKGVRFTSRKLNWVLVPEREIPFNKAEKETSASEAIAGMTSAVDNLIKAFAEFKIKLQSR